MKLKRSFLIWILLLISLSVVYADGTDWVDVNYIARQQKAPNSNTAAAHDSVLRAAAITARSGPWSVQTPDDQLPPSKNRNDYLSFAPYYWPDCNWCSTKRASFEDVPRRMPRSILARCAPPAPGPADAKKSSQKRKIVQHKRYFEDVFEMKLQLPPAPSRAFEINPAAQTMVSNFPSSVPLLAQSQTTTETTSSDTVVTGTLDPAQARAKTTKGSKCTPSPTTTMAPTATWTSCAYKNRDGQANPDTRDVAGPVSMNAMSQSVLFNALSYALTGTRSYSQKATSFIDAFFLSRATAMTPNINYGQVVRGVGAEHQKGTFTGVLDMRGMIKVVNAILALKVSKSPDWTLQRDQAMKTWMARYVNWLETSEIAQKTAKSANNHATFFYSQLAAVKILAGDISGARDDLNYFFSHQFQDHIASSGEQPFEAVRTRPYHYRCFNLEALITAAKLGDFLGLDFWTAKTRSGSTIQNALDFTIGKNPGSEPIENVFPHVAAIAAAYGDAGGKYSNFLRQHNSDYQRQRYWLYDQPSALNMAPTAHRKRELNGQSWHKRSEQPSEREKANHAATPSTKDSNSDETADPGQNQTATSKKITFVCPSVFASADNVELDNDVFVTCEQLRPFYVLFSPDE